MAIGRISGPMLYNNLERQGVDLSVDTDLVYFDVNNKRLGVGTNSPTESIDSPGNVRLANLSVLGNTIVSNTGKINLGTTSNVVISGGTAFDVLYTDGNGNLAFANLNVISTQDQFTGNNIALGINTIGLLDSNATHLTEFTSVTDSIALINQLLGNISNDTGTVITTTDVYGTLKTNIQPYITSVGTLDDLVVAGNLVVMGNTSTGYAELTTLDSVIDIHTYANLAPWTSNDGKDIGLKFHFFDESGDGHAFIGRANDTGFLEWYSHGSEGEGNVFTGVAYGTIKSGEYYAANITPATSVTTGALRVDGGVGIQGDLYAYSLNATHSNVITGYFGSLNTANAVITGGYIQTVANVYTDLLQADNLSSPNVLITGGTVYSDFIGNITADRITSNTGSITLTTTNTGVIEMVSNTALKLPTGDTAQRPSGIAGYIRYNSETSVLEYYSGSAWIPLITNISEQAITGNDADDTFTLDQETTAESIIVSINGTLQQPYVSYSVVGDQITFDEVPLSTDHISIRYIGTAISINANDLKVTGADIVVTTANTVVDTFDITDTRSARYTISSINDVDATMADVMVLQEGGVVTLNAYGILNTGTNTLTFYSNLSGNTVSLIAKGTVTNNKLKIQATYFSR